MQSVKYGKNSAKSHIFSEYQHPVFKKYFLFFCIDRKLNFIYNMVILEHKPMSERKV